MSIGRNPLTARSVVASTLLGTDPPWLPTRALVRAGALFGIAEGTIRTALSRMTASGELEASGDGYQLVGRLLDRQARQTASRRAETQRWDGTWELALVRSSDARAAADRAALRQALADLRLGELREGTWLRPANLPPDRSPEARRAAGDQCLWTVPTRLQPTPDPGDLWDLAAWAEDAAALRVEMDDLLPRLEGGDTAALRPGFVTSAAVLRLLQRDPLLPPELWPVAWPGDTLRHDYDRYDAAWRRSFRQHLAT
jgi:phenylacetic acid degradation operon negative regulatory protein